MDPDLWILPALVALLFLPRLLGAWLTTRIDDTVFGRLEWAIGAWHGQVFFEPENRQVTVAIEAESKTEPPAAADHAFWHRLLARYPALHPHLARAARETVGADDGFLLGDGVGELTLQAIGLPDHHGETDTSWSLSFVAEDGPYRYRIEVTLEDFTITDVDHGYATDATRREADRRVRQQYDITG